MDVQNHEITLGTSGDDETYCVFVVLALSNHLGNLEKKLERLDEDLYSEISVVRTAFEDKYVLWFAQKEEGGTSKAYFRAALLAGSYAAENGALYLTIEQVSKKYPALFWNIVEALRGNDAEINEESA